MASTKISGISMTPAENGIVIDYCKRTEKSGKSTYDNCSYEYPKEVFEYEKNESGEKESNDDVLERAMKRFKELWKESHNYK